MNVLRSKQNAKRSAEHWRRQYYHDGKWGTTISGSAEVTYRELLAANGDVAAIEKISSGWARPWCTECQTYQDDVVQFGGDYTVEVCAPCLRKALREIKVEDK